MLCPPSRLIIAKAQPRGGRACRLRQQRDPSLVGFMAPNPFRSYVAYNTRTHFLKLLTQHLTLQACQTNRTPLQSRLHGRPFDCRSLVLKRHFSPQPSCHAFQHRDYVILGCEHLAFLGEVSTRVIKYAGSLGVALLRPYGLQPDLSFLSFLFR